MPSPSYSPSPVSSHISLSSPSPPVPRSARPRPSWAPPPACEVPHFAPVRVGRRTRGKTAGRALLTAGVVILCWALLAYGGLR